MGWDAFGNHPDDILLSQIFEDWGKDIGKTVEIFFPKKWKRDIAYRWVEKRFGKRVKTWGKNSLFVDVIV